MIFCRKIEIETSDSRVKVLKKLRQVIETKEFPKPKSSYKGEFVKEGFIVVRKTSVSSFPPVWISGELIETQSGTNINVTITFHWTLKAVFWALNLILGVQFLFRLIRHIKDWPLFLGFLVFVWLFFILQSWLEVNGLKRTVMPLFEESEEGKEKETSSR